jgi:crotonobetaine/carnitine-CoA ligase
MRDDAVELLRALDPGDQTLSALLHRQAAAHPDKLLLRGEDGERTYAGMRDAAARMAGTLARWGVRRGDRVAVLTDRTMPLVDLWLGSAWLGAVLVPLNTASRGPQLAHALYDSGAKLVAIDQELLPVLEALDRLPTTLRHAWTLGDGDELARDRVGHVPLKPLPRPQEAVGRCAVGPMDPAAIIYTSGTTGAPKGVVCPHAQWLWFAANAIDAMGIVEDDVLYTCLPLFHVNGLSTVVEALQAGATCVKGPRFSASRFWSRLVEERATVTFLLGVMMPILLGRDPDPAERAHSVRVALAGAAPAHLATSFAQRFGVALVDGYASTETNMVMRNGSPEFRPGMIGALAPRFEALVVDEHDREVTDGTAGELLLRSQDPWAFSRGYLGLPEQTLESRRNFWFHTGDRVVREADGWFRFVDRMNDVIRRRGENISSFEVEQVVEAHPDVETAAAYGVPSELGEDEVMVCVVAKSAAFEPALLLDWCAPQLPSFALPRYVDVADAMPLTETGKIKKSALRARGITAQTYDRVG